MRSMNIRTPRKKFAHAWYAYSTVCVFENQIRPCLDFTTTLLFQSFAKLANRQSVHKSQQQLTNLLPPERLKSLMMPNNPEDTMVNTKLFS